MSETHLCKHAPLLCWIANGKPNVVKVIIKEADRGLVSTFSECAHNILERNIELNTKQKRKLKPRARDLILLADKKTSDSRKKKALQKGGLAGTIASIAAPIATSMLQDLFKPEPDRTRRRPYQFGAIGL